MPLDPIRKLVIVGGGTAGWMCAALMAKLMRTHTQNPLDIELVESDDIGTIGVGEATIPAIKTFNRLLGFDETEFIRATQGTFKLGIEFTGWGDPDASYIHGFGKIGQDLGWLRMHQYWLKMRGSGRVPEDFAAYSINTEAAYAGRFMRSRPDMKDSPLSEIAYAYHFDAGLYARFLRRLAEGWGVRRTEGKVAHVEQRAEDGFITAIVLESGARIDGDLFLDCSGMHALLIEKTLKSGFEPYTDVLPCDRAVAVPCSNAPQLLPYTRSIARKAGWQWRIPLQHRIGNGHVFSSAFISEDEAVATLMDNLDGEPLAEPRVIRFTTGRRRKSWLGNVVAIGLASGFMEPLESTSIHMIQSGILRLVALWPDRACAAVHRDSFNTQTEFEYTRIRDFLVAHYHLNGRVGEPMWDHCRHMAIPDTLKTKLADFGAYGRVFKVHDELFAEESWIQVLIGQGLIPEAYDPAVDLKDEATIVRYLNDIAGVIKKCVAVMPPHGDYIDKTCKAA